MTAQSDRFIPNRGTNWDKDLASFGALGESMNVASNSNTFASMLFDENPRSLFDDILSNKCRECKPRGSMRRSHVLDAPGVNSSAGQPVSICGERIAFATDDAVHLWSEKHLPLRIYKMHGGRVAKSLQWLDESRLTVGLSTGSLSALQVDQTGKAHGSKRHCSTHAVVAIDPVTHGSRRQIVGDDEGRLYWHVLNQQRATPLGQPEKNKKLSFLTSCQGTFNVTLQYTESGIHYASLWDTRKFDHPIADLGEVTSRGFSWCSQQTLALGANNTVRFFDTKQLKECDAAMHLPGVVCTVTWMSMPKCSKWSSGLAVSYQDAESTLLDVISLPSLYKMPRRSVSLYEGLYSMTHAQYSATSQTMILTSDAEELHVLQHY